MVLHYILFGVEWCIWDIPAFLLLAAVLVVFLVYCHKQKKREDAFEKALEEARNADSVFNNPTPSI